MASFLEFCPEGSLKFSWSASGPTNATHNVQEATGCQECTIGLVLYELTGIRIRPGYLLKALSQLKKATDSNSWHHHMLDRFVACAIKQKVATNASASENHSDISIGCVLQGQETDVRGFCIVDCDQLQPMPMQAECVTAPGAGVACRAPITLEQRIACYRTAIEGNMKGPRNADGSLVEGRPYEKLLAQWRVFCRRLRGVSLQDANMSSTRTLDSSVMINNTAALKNVQTRENVSSQSGQSLLDQILQLSQELAESKTLVADLQQQLSNGVVEVLVPTGEKILTAKDFTQETLHRQSTLPNPLAKQSQELTAGGIGGCDIGGGGEIAGAGMQIVEKETLQNNKRACRGAKTRSSDRAEEIVEKETLQNNKRACRGARTRSSDPSWVMEGVNQTQGDV